MIHTDLVPKYKTAVRGYHPWIKRSGTFQIVIKYRRRSNTVGKGYRKFPWSNAFVLRLHPHKKADVPDGFTSPNMTSAKASPPNSPG